MLVSILGFFLSIFVYVEDNTNLKNVLNKNSIEDNNELNNSNISSKADKDSIFKQIGNYNVDEETYQLKKEKETSNFA